MNSYGLSKRADADLLEIFISGIERFGLAQAGIYQGELAYCFQLLADNPRMGRKADAIGAGVRRHETGSHVILYEEIDGGVLILGLVYRSSIRRLKL